MMYRIKLGIAAMVAACVVAVLPSAPVQAGSVSFGIVPQQSASRLARTWGPFLAELGARAGMDIQLRTTKDIPTFEACLAANAFDIAYMNPMHYAVFAGDDGYDAVGHQTKKRLRGILVKRKDTAIDALSDLEGARLAFPSPGAFGASVLTRAALQTAGVGFDPAYVESHDSVYRAVAAGLMPAGGGVLRTFNAVEPAIRDQLEIFFQTDAFTPHAFAALPSLSGPDRDRLIDAMAGITQERPDLLKNIGMQGIEQANDTDWDDVRNLNMTRTMTGIASREQPCPSG